MDRAAARAVRFDRYGDRDVLYVADIPMPVPGKGEVLVEIRATGINPAETKIRTGASQDRFPLTFPSGEGSDLADIVTEVGPGVDNFVDGDEVLGFSRQHNSHATHAIVPVTQLIRKPSALSWEVAGSLYIVGCTAYAAVRAVDPHPGEIIAVSAASGGVGTIVVQLLRQRGVRVLGIASPDGDSALIEMGAIPIHYGRGLAKRLTAAALDGIDAFIDLYGPDYVRLAIDFGVHRDRIETIAFFADAAKFGIKADGCASASTAEVLAEVADLVASGTIDLPIAAAYALDQVKDAFGQLEKGHTHGKIVLVP
jgi:NADPH2:quinone reductase